MGGRIPRSHLPRVIRAADFEVLRQRALAAAAAKAKPPAPKPPPEPEPLAAPGSDAFAPATPATQKPRRAVPMPRLIGEWGQRVFGDVLEEFPRTDPGFGPLVPAFRLLRGIIK